ncbi:hypothetical protein Tco_0814134 [Tanacetum coccineum]
MLRWPIIIYGAITRSTNEGYEDADRCSRNYLEQLEIHDMVYLILFKTSNFLVMIKKSQMLTSDIFKQITSSMKFRKSVLSVAYAFPIFPEGAARLLAMN